MRTLIFLTWMLAFLLVILAVIQSANGQSIAPARRAEISRALRSHGYSGDMDTALKQVAKDHGWQSKIAPDSRVLIWLGLGPKPRHLLNPETAWISTPTTVTTKK